MLKFRRLFLGSTNINFVRVGKIFFRVFIIEMILFVIIAAFIATNYISLNLSIDFTGGTLYEIPTTKPIETEQIELIIEELTLDVTRYESINNGESYRFRTVEGTISAEQTVLNELSIFFDIPEKDINFQRVGPTFGDEISRLGLRALVIFVLFISLLITYRYQIRYALIALIALMHDLLFCVSVYVLIGIEITPSTIIAVLTVLGYSLYDTVVIFDKLRDSQSKSKDSRSTIDSINKTFNEVLMRSINTSLTSIIPIASLIMVGNYLGLQGALQDFAIPLLIGMLSGTYSSIFVTTPFITKFFSN